MSLSAYNYRLDYLREARDCRICGAYSDEPHHSHECRDCGADIDCHGHDGRNGCERWAGGNSDCPNPDCHD